MIALISFCSFPWWLAWLLPFLLGLGLGWAIWGKYKSMIKEYEANIASLNNKLKGVEASLSECRTKTADLEGDVALAKGRVREMEYELSNIKSSSSGSPAGMAAGFAAGAASGATTGASVGKYAKLKSDNLQIIEGLGPKMDEVLKENGIGDWAALAAQTPESLREVLNKYGDSYKIIDPGTWPAQAKLAAEGDFEGLMALQKNLDTGVATGTQSDSKLEKLLIKLGIIRVYKQDDLKIVEGIGPKIEEVLHQAGITTWKALAESEVEQLKEILSAAGSHFQLADPGTWPKQAQLAHEAKWSELESYQEFLQGGKE